ncbi:MAG: APC family permease, partial [Phycisphaerae bacterium]
MTARREPPALRRILGPISVVCVGVGGAIGSGIFRTPGKVAESIQSPWLILLLWVLAGGITLMQSLVSAELATRFPRAGGEYEYLKRAYGDFAAFFFGWSCTLFIIGAGAATIAAALGDFAAELGRLDRSWASPAFGCAAIITVTAVNALGLRTGAFTQNLLTLLKVAALMGIAIGAWILSGRLTPIPSPVVIGPNETSWTLAFLMALLPAFWPYTGATDSVRLAEEVKDVRKAMPRALFSTVAVLTVVYFFYNYALLCAVSPVEMAGDPGVHARIFASDRGFFLREAILIVSILICLGSITAVFLANVRVTYALARDGLTFRFLSRMSRSQAPVASFMVVGLIACAFVLSRSFEKMLKIYFLASAFLFGMTYLSLIVFRLRDRRAGRAFPEDAYRAPAGALLGVLLILIELAIAVSIIVSDITAAEPSFDSLIT